MRTDVVVDSSPPERRRHRQGRSAMPRDIAKAGLPREHIAKALSVRLLVLNANDVLIAHCLPFIVIADANANGAFPLQRHILHCTFNNLYKFQNSIDLYAILYIIIHLLHGISIYITIHTLVRWYYSIKSLRLSNGNTIFSLFTRHTVVLYTDYTL